MKTIKKLNTCDTSDFLCAFFFCVFAAFLLAALAMSDRRDMLKNFGDILFSTCKASTSYFAIGGLSGTFLNVSLVCLSCTAIYVLTGAKANGTSVIAFLLTAGFAFWGINLINMWFGMLGVLLYCAVKRVKPATQVNTMLFTTGLAPLISDMLLRYPNVEAATFHREGFLLALGVGIVIGFILPFGLPHSPNAHKGYAIYSAALPLGLIAFFLRVVLYKVLGVELPGSPTWTLDYSSWAAANLFCIALFGLFILVAVLAGATPKGYLALLKDSGHKVDFVEKYGNATALMNLGVYGLFILLYYNLIGASFNAVTLGCVFCMLACGCSGSHPRNVLPIMLGYVAASFAMKGISLGILGTEYAHAINAQAIVVGLCFANGLSPIAGKFGFGWGIFAGAAHFLLVTGVPDLHGGFCLYNGGLTACFVSILFVPMIEALARPREKVDA